MEVSSFCCLGDSITSDQVSGIGTRIGQRLNAQYLFNAACGYATGSDWHNGSTNITPLTLLVPPNTNTPDNVLSNQVYRVLQAMTAADAPICWTVDGQTHRLPESLGKGTGLLPAPQVIYIAISTNDGNQPQNATVDDFDAVADIPCSQQRRCSLASSLLWAVGTLQSACPNAAIFLATPLQTYTDQPWMDEAHGLLKRRIIRRVAEKTGVHCIDSFYESGFDRETARLHGEVHPDDEWKERIADFVTAEIIRALGKE